MLHKQILLAALLGSAPVAAADLAPYEATYDLRLTRASSTYGPRAAVGFYQYRVAETCDGWETKSHIVVDLTFREEQTYTNERFFTSWEAKAGNAYRFVTQTTKNGNTVEAFKGTATVTAKGGQAVYEPLADPARKDVKKVTLPLPPGTLLPLAHARALLEHARNGEALFRSVVLNGSYSTGPRVLSVAIGPRHGEFSPGPATPDFDPKLLATPNWQISTAAFNLGENRDVPNFETAVQIHETGIAQNFEQTFFDYALSAQLSRLQRLEKPVCR